MLTEESLHTIDATQENKRAAIAMHVREILKLLGENSNRDGLLDTPMRVAKMYEEVLGGMQIDPERILGTTFEETTGGPVIVSDITFYSLCEHHMVPFFGTAHVAYLPGEQIVGISKIARLVDAYARRLQVQERMTEQVVQTIESVLQPKGAIALIEAEHTCMCARGIKKPGSKTTTLAARGVYQDNYDLRREFLQMIGRGQH
jgi:GTP cyclohydrolase IA